MDDTSPRLLTESEVATRLNCTEGTLRNWRSQGRGPKWIVNPDTSRFIGYRSEAVDSWLERGEEAAVG